MQTPSICINESLRKPDVFNRDNKIASFDNSDSNFLSPRSLLKTNNNLNKIQ